MDFERLQAVLRALEAHGVRYAVFGAVALKRARTRAIHRGSRHLRRAGAGPHRPAPHRAALGISRCRNQLGAYPAIQYVPPDGAFHIDIVTRLGEAFAFSDLRTERLPFGDLTITVVTPRTLYEMKRDTVRLKDRADADLLRRRFRLEE